MCDVDPPMIFDAACRRVWRRVKQGMLSLQDGVVTLSFAVLRMCDFEYGQGNSYVCYGTEPPILSVCNSKT